MTMQRLSTTYSELQSSQLNELVGVLDSLRPEAINVLRDELIKRENHQALEKIKAHYAREHKGLNHNKLYK